jgi:hypothetical protein
MSVEKGAKLSGELRVIDATPSFGSYSSSTAQGYSSPNPSDDE